MWNGSRNPKGYGEVRAYGRSALAHRIAWEIATGETPPAGTLVLHTCDNPRCVRNDSAGTYTVRGRVFQRVGHLWLGDAAANSADMVEKGRSCAGRKITR